MKRDLDLIRDILLKIESFDKDRIYAHDLATNLEDLKKACFHIRLLMDNNYIEAIDASTKISDDYIIKRITSAGFDYLDNIRDDKVWAKTKSKVESVALSASLDVIKVVAGKIITTSLGI